MRAGILLTAIMLTATLTVQADTVDRHDASLPPGLIHGSSVWTGDAMYVFGGYDTSAEGSAKAVDTIARYDPATGEVRVMDARLPTGRWYTTAVWTGEKAYVFGGNTYHAWASDHIIEYDPATDTATLLDVRLPIPIEAGSAVWTASAAYILGGDGYPDEYGRIQRFDPATMTVTLLDPSLPSGYGGYTNAAWANGAAYIAPSSIEQGERGALLRYDPATGAMTPTAEILRGHVTSLVSDGTRLYAFGAGGRYDEMLRYDTATGHAAIMPGRLPDIFDEVAAWADERALAFGSACWQPPCAYHYTPQDVVPEPRVSVEIREYEFAVKNDGSVEAWFWVDLLVEDAPIYDPQMSVTPGPAGSPATLVSATAKDVFGSGRYEVGEHRGRLFVVRDAFPSPISCLQLVADSGNTEHGDVSSQVQCAAAQEHRVSDLAAYADAYARRIAENVDPFVPTP